MPCRSSFLCRAVAISARGLSVFRAVGLNVLRVAGILIFCSVQQLSVPCSSFLFRAAAFCSVQLFSVPCSCFLFRAVVFCAAAGLYLWATVDRTDQIQHMTRDLHISDRPQDTFREIQRTLPLHKIDENQNEIRPPAAGIRTQQQDVFFIPPPRAGGGAVGVSTPVSTATLGLIHKVDQSLAVLGSVVQRHR